MNKKTKKYNNSILNKIFSEISPQEQKRTDNRMLLAAKIKDGMNAKGWKNKHLTEALNQQPSVITKWLSGTHNFTSDTLSDIENILGIKLLAVEEKRDQQVISYRTQISAVVVNEPDKGRH
jgi:ribosome-binding protein aMBF1 (putative translation factor)